MTARENARCAARYRRWMDRAFTGRLGARPWRRLRAHIEVCDACRARFDRLGYAGRAFSDGPLDAGARDRIASEVIIGAAPASGGRARMWIGAAAAVAVAAAGLFLLVTRDDTSQDVFQPRGVRDAAPLVPGERAPGVRIFCVDPDASAVVGAGRATGLEVSSPPLRCMIDSELQLAYSTPSLHGLTMIAFARDERGRIFWYAPRAEGDLAFPLEADVVDEALPWSTRLAVKHHPGRYEIVIRFFDRPVTGAEALTGAVPPRAELRGELEIQGDAP